MRAGDLRHVGVLQRRAVGSPQKTSRGAPDATWADFLTGVHAAIEPLRGREFLEAQALQSAVSVRIRIRYRDGVTPDMRFVCRGKTYDIAAVINVTERDRELHLMCSQGASNG